MKKLLSLLLVFTLVFALSACGKNNTSSDADTGVSSTQTENESNDVGGGSNDTSITETDNNSATDSTVKEESKPSSSAENSKPVESSKPTNSTSTPSNSKPAESSKPDESSKQEVTSNNVFFNPNNSNYDLNAVSIKPRYVYWENGMLVAECFVINGFSHNVFNINVKSITFGNPSGMIASGSGFGVLNNVTLPPYTNIIWTFRFAPDAITNYGADLSQLSWDVNVSNSY